MNLKKNSALSLFVLLFSMTACQKTAPGGYKTYGSDYAIVEGTEDLPHFRNDRNEILRIFDTEVSLHVKLDQRVLIDFAYVPEDMAEVVPGEQKILINRISKVLKKDLTTASDPKLGKEPLDLLQASMGGKYINLTFYLRYGNSSKAHYINMVPEPIAGGYRLHLYHSNGSDATGLKNNALGRASFDVFSLLRPGDNELNIELAWVDKDGAPRELTGYKLRRTNNFDILLTSMTPPVMVGETTLE